MFSKVKKYNARMTRMSQHMVMLSCYPVKKVMLEGCLLLNLLSGTRTFSDLILLVASQKSDQTAAQIVLVNNESGLKVESVIHSRHDPLSGKKAK